MINNIYKEIILFRFHVSIIFLIKYQMDSSIIMSFLNLVINFIINFLFFSQIHLLMAKMINLNSHFKTIYEI